MCELKKYIFIGPCCCLLPKSENMIDNTRSFSALEGSDTSGRTAREEGQVLRNVNSMSDLENKSPQVK